jgi:hypothetical protein
MKEVKNTKKLFSSGIAEEKLFAANKINWKFNFL